MRLLLLSLPACVCVIVGVGIIGPSYQVPWWKVLRMSAAASMILAAGLLLADAFAVGRSSERPFGALPAGWLKVGILLAALFMGGGLFLAGSAGRMGALALGIAAFLVLASGGLPVAAATGWPFAGDMLPPLAWSIAYASMTLAGAAIFPEFGYRVRLNAEGMELWRPACLVWLSALMCGLFARSLDAEASRRTGWLLAGMLIVLSALSALNMRRPDAVAVGAWLLLLGVTAEQAIMALSRSRRLGAWIARRLLLVQPAGVGAAWLAGGEGARRTWGILATAAFAVCALVLIAALGPAETRAGFGENTGG